MENLLQQYSYLTHECDIRKLLRELPLSLEKKKAVIEHIKTLRYEPRINYLRLFNLRLNNVTEFLEKLAENERRTSGGWLFTQLGKSTNSHQDKIFIGLEHKYKHLLKELVLDGLVKTTLESKEEYVAYRKLKIVPEKSLAFAKAINYNEYLKELDLNLCEKIVVLMKEKSIKFNTKYSLFDMKTDEGLSINKKLTVYSQKFKDSKGKTIIIKSYKIEDDILYEMIVKTENGLHITDLIINEYSIRELTKIKTNRWFLFGDKVLETISTK